MRPESDSRRAPRAKKEVFACYQIPQRRKLPLDLVRCEKIIRIQILDVVPLAMPIGIVLARRKAIVLRRENGDSPRGESPRHCYRSVCGPIVHYDDFFAWPGLGNSRFSV